MTTQAWIILSQQERDDAELLNNEDSALGSRQIDNTLANNLGLGDLQGKWVAPVRLLNDPEYARWVPTLGLLPIAVMDSDTLFTQ